MRRHWLGLVAAGLSLLVGSVSSSAQFYQQRPNATPPTTPGVRTLTSSPAPGNKSTSKVTTPAAAPTPVTPSPSPSFGHHHHHGSTGLILWGGFPLVWGSGFTPAVFPYSPLDPYFMVGPSYAPAPVLPPAPKPGLPAVDRDAGPAPPKGKPKATSAEQKAKAGKFIGFGDANFGKQKYLPAAERYKAAAEIAPDLAEAFFRQGFALAAMAQFDSAAKAFRRGLNIRPDWSDSAFRLDQIYGNDRLAKTTHLETLAKAVEDHPLDSNLLLVLGMQLYFDGQRQRSELFFARVAQLGGNDDQLLNEFLPKPAPADARPKAGEKISF